MKGGNGFFFGQVLRYTEVDLQVITLANEASEAAETLARTLASSVLTDLVDDELEWELLIDRERQGRRPPDSCSLPFA